MCCHCYKYSVNCDIVLNLILISKLAACADNKNLNIYLSRLIPQVAENAAARALSEAKPLEWRRPTPKACRRAKSRGREGGHIQQLTPDQAFQAFQGFPNIYESVETRCLPYRRAKLCLSLSLTQTLSHTQKDGETETVIT